MFCVKSIVLTIIFTKSVNIPMTFGRSIHPANSCEPPIYWTTGLREATYRTLTKQTGVENSQLRDQLYNSPIVGVKINSEPQFGDIVLLAKGQLYRTPERNYKFIQDVSDVNCDRFRCNEPNNGVSLYDVLIGVWTVERVRHLDLTYGYYFEFQYNIILEADLRTPLINRDGKFDYGAPGHLYIIKLCKPPTKANQKWTSLDGNLFKGHTEDLHSIWLHKNIQNPNKDQPPPQSPTRWTNYNGKFPNKNSEHKLHSIWVHRDGRQSHHRSGFHQKFPHNHPNDREKNKGHHNLHSVWIHQNIQDPKAPAWAVNPSQSNVPGRHYLDPNVVVRISQDGYKHVIHRIPEFEEDTKDDTFLFGIEKQPPQNKSDDLSTAPTVSSKDPIFDEIFLNKNNATKNYPEANFEDIFTTKTYNENTILSLTTEKSMASTEPMIVINYTPTSNPTSNTQSINNTLSTPGYSDNTSTFSTTQPKNTTGSDGNNFYPTTGTHKTTRSPQSTIDSEKNTSQITSATNLEHSASNISKITTTTTSTTSTTKSTTANRFTTSKSVTEITSETIIPSPSTTISTFLEPEPTKRKPPKPAVKPDSTGFLTFDDYSDLTTQKPSTEIITTTTTTSSLPPFLIPDSVFTTTTRKANTLAINEFLAMDGQKDFTSPSTIRTTTHLTSTTYLSPFLITNSTTEKTIHPTKIFTLNKNEFLADAEFTTQALTEQTEAQKPITSTTPPSFLEEENIKNTSMTKTTMKVKGFLADETESYGPTVENNITDLKEVNVTTESTVTEDFLKDDPIEDAMYVNTLTERNNVFETFPNSEDARVDVVQIDLAPYPTKKSPTLTGGNTVSSNVPKRTQKHHTTRQQKTFRTEAPNYYSINTSKITPKTTRARKVYSTRNKYHPPSFSTSTPILHRTDFPIETTKATLQSKELYGSRRGTLTSRGTIKFSTTPTTTTIQQLTITTPITYSAFYATLPSFITPETTIVESTQYYNYPTTEYIHYFTTTAPTTANTLRQPTTTPHPENYYPPDIISRTYIPPVVSNKSPNRNQQRSTSPQVDTSTTVALHSTTSIPSSIKRRQSKPYKPKKLKSIPRFSMSTTPRSEPRNANTTTKKQREYVNCKIYPITPQPEESGDQTTVTSRFVSTTPYRPHIQARRPYTRRPSKIHSTLVVNRELPQPTQSVPVVITSNFYLPHKENRSRTVSTRRKAILSNSDMVEDELLETAMTSQEAKTYRKVKNKIKNNRKKISVSPTKIDERALGADVTTISIPYNTASDMEILTSQSYSTSISFNVGERNKN